MRSDVGEAGKGGVLLLIVVVLLGAAAAGVYYFTVGSSETLVAGSGASPSATPSPMASYGWGEVLLEVERKPDGVSVYFVNEGRATFADLALRCVERYRKDFDSVSCYGFPSAEAFQTAEVDPETGGMKKKCWQAYYSVAGRGKGEKESAGAIDNGQAGGEGCPTT